MPRTSIFAYRCFLLFACAAAGGCGAITAVPLRDLSLAPPRAVEPAQRTTRSFLVVPFLDERGREYARAYPTSNIPFVNLVHQGGQLAYPEQAGALRRNVDDRTEITTGALDAALPSLLADMMRRSGYAPGATAAAPAIKTPNPRAYDYVVSGRIRTTQYRQHTSVLLGATLGLLGAPCYFTYYDLEYEISLYAGKDPDRPILQRTYKFSDSRIGGLYYNEPSVYRMFVRGLEETLPQVILDLAAATRA